MSQAIFIIDRNTEAQNQANEALVEGQWQIHSFVNRTEAMEQIPVLQPWLYIVGEFLSDCTGIEFLQQVKEVNQKEATPLTFSILLLAPVFRRQMPSPPNPHQYPLVVDMYIASPFHPLELQAFVRRLWDQFESR